ncbi:MAG: hypothetical protein Q8M26_04770 [Pseudolabrys sp.]|nr:hypothetical protein [Pseudolabrys sp.]
MTFLVTAGATALPAAAEPVYPAGLRVGLEPVGKLVPSQRFPGFEDAERKVAVTVVELPGIAYAELERSALAKDQPGIEGVEHEKFSVSGGIGVLVSGQSTQDGAAAKKWILLAGGTPEQDLTMLINVQVPEAARDVYTDDLIRKLLASVTVRGMPIDEQIGMLPFTLGDMAGFRVMQVMPAGGAILTDGPSDDISKQPYMIVSVGRGGPANASDRGRFVNDLLMTTPLREVRLQLSEPMRLSGQPGYETRAQAKGPAEEPVALVQWVRFGSGGFLRVIGVAPKEQWDTLFPRFRAVRDGVEAK